MRNKNVKDDRERARSYLQNHVVKVRPSISWHMNKTYPDGSYDSAYAYAVTWTPGTLVISGDLGEFTVTHYHAMTTIEHTLMWLDNISFDYLMSKSSAKEEFDRDATVRDIIRMANEEALYTYRSCRSEARRLRKDRVEALCRWDGDETFWAVNAPRCDERRPALLDYMPDPDLYDTRDRLHCEKVTRSALDSLRFGTTYDRWRAPDGFDLWLKLYIALRRDVRDRGLGPDMILHAWGRREIKAALEAHIGDCHAEATSEFCHTSLDMDDYYGSYSWPFQCYLWAEAIQRWVDLVKPDYTKPKAEPVQPGAGEVVA